ncbi:hypothetical protein D3C85_1432120 [compost metagenome]
MRSSTAISNRAALPEPLSLMPAPSNTESRCAPAMTTLFGLPRRVSATRLKVSVFSRITSTTMRNCSPAVCDQATPLS